MAENSVDQTQLTDLLILEDSLRREYLQLKTLRRKYTLILVVLLLWNSFFLYHAWTAAATRPAFLSFMIRFCCLIGFSTLILFYASGLYHDTLVEPRKFIPRANRALRHFNVKLVPTKRGWLRFFKANKPGQGLRLIVSSKAGSIHFREAFEEYRNTYWQQVEVNQGTKQHDK